MRLIWVKSSAKNTAVYALRASIDIHRLRSVKPVAFAATRYAARFIRVRYGGIRRNIKMRELFQEEGGKVDEQGNFNGSPYT